MKSRSALVASSVAALGFLAGALALAQPEKKPAAPTGQPEMKLPKGWTPEDMQACMIAGMPGKEHAFLAKNAGSWHGKQKMWMGPDMDPMPSECTTTVTSIMDGRFVKVETSGDMAGMGPFSGMGLMGYDNVSKQYVATWIDNMGTGMMQGTGELSADGKTMTWTYTYNCPINKKPAKMREVETLNGDGKMTMEMFNTDPKTGKEFKMLHIDYTK